MSHSVKMEDEDGIPNKRGEAYCACRYLNCGRKFKSLKALEEHLISLHNISWEAYTRYSPSRHHETIEEAVIDPLGKRKDAYCTCTFMECGRKFKMLKNLEEHVTLYHNISWQLYTQYYHRSVRKAPEVEKSKSPKVEKTPSPYSAAVKTSESPSPSSSTMRSTSNGSASTTPVSVGMGMGSPVAASPMMSFLPPQTSVTYGQYPYLTAQVPLVPTIIQYQPMLTPSVLGYGPPALSALPQSYISQPAPIPMSPLPEPQSWYQPPSSHLAHPQPQQDSGILNLSCPKSKKTRPVSPPATTLDLSMSKSSRSYRPSSGTSQSQKFTELNVPTPTYLNSYAKPSTDNLYKRSTSYCPIAPKEPRRDERWAGDIHHAHTEAGEWSPKNLPDTRNGVIVIEPDDHYADRTVQVNNRVARSKEYLEDSMYMYTKAYCEEMYQRSLAASTSYPQDTSRDYSRLCSRRSYQSAFSPKHFQHQHQDRVEDLSRPGLKYTPDQASNFSLKSNESARTSQRCSYDSHNHYQAKNFLEKKSEEIFQELTNSKSELVGAGSCTTASPDTAHEKKCLNQQSELLQTKPVSETHVAKVNKDVDVDDLVAAKLKKVLRKSSGMQLSMSMCRRTSFPPVRKIKRSSSMPNLNTGTCSEEADETFSCERLVIDIADEQLPRKNDKQPPQTRSTEEQLFPPIINMSAESNESKKAKQTSICHLKLKPKLEPKHNRQQMTRCGRKLVVADTKKKRKCSKKRKPPALVNRTYCIKRKYKHLNLRRCIQGKARKHPSVFCKLRLNSRSKIPNSCRLCKKNCDSGEVADAHANDKEMKVRMSRKPKKMTELTPKGPVLLSTPGQLGEESRPDVDVSNQEPGMLPATKSTSWLVKLTVGEITTPKSDDSSGNQAFFDTKKLLYCKTQQDLVVDPVVDRMERTVRQVWPLKILADSSYRSCRNMSVDLSQTVVQTFLENCRMKGERNSSQSAVPLSSTPLIKCRKLIAKDSSGKELMRDVGSHLDGATRDSALSFQWRRLRFMHASPDTTIDSNAVIISCSACSLNFNRKSDYVKHRLREHQVYMCKVCKDCGPRRSHLYRYLATLTRHLMLDHGVTTALDPHVWATQDAYAGVDLQGVPYIDNLDNLCLVTDDKIYTSDTVYTYTMQCGFWTLGRVSAADPRQVAARGAVSTDTTHQAAPLSAVDVLKDGASRGGEGSRVMVSSHYPPVLLTIVDMQYSVHTSFKR